ncbi:RHS repeat-associated core domain-containing protein [Serratia marcescens]|uniref:RHS repeat-associated core domain-containing protein n=1 Tax=Serratia marcescens TaxID=615 RepID=UPI001EEFFA3A|nr:RHS repeat-associated core domain-containing protein [Serratia marcescens]ULH12269.1 RHS repeat-associated core domain-containing protein [Serratia marcescens]
MTNQPEHLAASTLDSPLGFNGERTDPALGSYHLGNGYRLYNPTLRRFTAPDNMSPFGAGGINPYAYCEGDPINNTDPTGHSPLSTIFLLGMLMMPGGGAVDDVAEGEAAMERHFTQIREADEKRMGSNRTGKRAHSGTGDDNIAVRRARPDTAGPSTSRIAESDVLPGDGQTVPNLDANALIRKAAEEDPVAYSRQLIPGRGKAHAAFIRASEEERFLDRVVDGVAVRDFYFVADDFVGTERGIPFSKLFADYVRRHPRTISTFVPDDEYLDFVEGRTGNALFQQRIVKVPINSWLERGCPEEMADRERTGRPYFKGKYRGYSFYRARLR